MNTLTERKKWLPMCMMLIAAISLAACSDDDDGDAKNHQSLASYEITVTNLTAGQPFSTPVVIMHGAQWKAFETGKVASEALEKLSEGGNSSDLATAVGANNNVYGHTSGAGDLEPGGDHKGTQKLVIEVDTDVEPGLRVTVLTMLVNTNDAIAAVNGEDISGMAVGESRTWMANTYDTGTEANTETAGTIPGPASTVQNKEGFNAARDDIRDEVHLHAGVVTSDDGLSTSALKYLHRWDNPAMQVIVKRIPGIS